MSFSFAPSKTGVMTFQPSSAAARPRWTSSTCPMFIRDGTPRGFKTMSSGRAVRQVGHILLRQHPGDDALVAVASGHLVADRDLSLLGDVAADHHVDARRELVAVFAGEDLHVHDDAVFAVRHAQGGVAHLARLLAEDRAQQALLRVELGLALGRDLAHEDVAGAHLGAHADDAAFVELLERVVADVGDVAGDLLGSQLGVAGLDLIFLDVDRGVDIVLDKALVDEHRVLVVVALPGHEADEHVAARALISPLAVDGPSAMTWPTSTCSPFATMGRWLMHVPWLERMNLIRW